MQAKKELSAKTKKNFEPEVLTGVLLIISTVIAIIIANTPLIENYNFLFHDLSIFKNFNLHMLVNDFLMAIFFLLAGLEIKHEVLHGNLSSVKKATFPVIAACGGVIVPAIIFFYFNYKTKFINGIGVPISTDIAFAVGIFMLLKNKLNPSLKVFLLSLAVVDDLISIIVIGIAYSSNLNLVGIIGAVVVLSILMFMNKVLKINKSYLYLMVGAALWYFVYISGVHSTISGVLLSLAIPSKAYKGDVSVLDKLLDKLGPLCNYFILPLFAFSNTAINLNVSLDYGQVDKMMLGIMVGLVLGKPIGIMLFTYIGTKLHLTEKPKNCRWISLLEVSMLAGIGFTMSIFVAEIAFEGSSQLIDVAKISILMAAVLSASLTYMTITLKPVLSKSGVLKYLHSGANRTE